MCPSPSETGREEAHKCRFFQPAILGVQSLFSPLTPLNPPSPLGLWPGERGIGRDFAAAAGGRRRKIPFSTPSPRPPPPRGEGHAEARPRRRSQRGRRRAGGPRRGSPEAPLAAWPKASGRATPRLARGAARGVAEGERERGGGQGGGVRAQRARHAPWTRAGGLSPPKNLLVSQPQCCGSTCPASGQFGPPNINLTDHYTC